MIQRIEAPGNRVITLPPDPPPACVHGCGERTDGKRPFCCTACEAISTRYYGAAAHDVWGFFYWSTATPAARQDIEEAVALGILDRTLGEIRFPSYIAFPAYQTLVGPRGAAAPTLVEERWPLDEAQKFGRLRDAALKLSAYRYYRDEVAAGRLDHEPGRTPPSGTHIVACAIRQFAHRAPRVRERTTVDGCRILHVRGVIPILAALLSLSAACGQVPHRSKTMRPAVAAAIAPAGGWPCSSRLVYCATPD